MFPAASTASALPPTWAVEKTIAVPAGFTSVRYGDSLVPTVVPLTIAAPDAFTATACAKLFVAPPRNIEYTSSPVALSFATYDRSWLLPGGVLPVLAVMGKSGEFVTPAMYALPAPSTAIPATESFTDPPMNRV